MSQIVKLFNLILNIREHSELNFEEMFDILEGLSAMKKLKARIENKNKIIM